MRCSANIATRAGLPCILNDSHEGSCLPELPRGVVPRFVEVLVTHWSTTSEAEFVGHLLAIVESAGDTLTFIETVNISRALLRARIGRPPF